MLRYLIILNLIAYFFIPSYAQDLHADTLQARKLRKDLPKDKQKAFEQLQEAAKLYQKHNLQELYISAMLDAFLYTTEDHESIVDEQKKRLATVLKDFKSNTPLLIKAYKRLGQAYAKKGAFKNAIEQFQLAESTLKKAPNYSKIELVYIYIELIRNYGRLGDHQRAVGYLTTAESTARQIKTTQYPLAQVLQIKSGVYIQEPKGIELIEEAVQLVKKEFGAQSPKLFDFLQYEATVHHMNKDSDTAIKLMKALIAQKKAYYGSGNSDNLDVARSYIDLGMLYKDWKSAIHSREDRRAISKSYIPLAIETHLEAIRIYEVLGIKVGVNLSVLYRNLGNLYRLINDYDKALKTFHKGVLALLPNETDTDHNKVLPIANTNKICIDWIQAFLVTRNKLVAFKEQYLEENNKEAGHRMFETILEVDAMLDEYSKSISNDALHLIYQLRHDFVTAATLRALEHYYLEFKNPKLRKDIHRIFEKNKNSQLLSSLQSSEESQLGNVDETLLEKEKVLKKGISKAKKKLLDANTQKDSLAILEHQKDILDLQIEYEKFLKEIAIKYPEYHNLKYKTAIPDIASLQKELKANEAIIDYQVKGDWVAMVYIEKDTVLVQLIERKKNQKITDLVKKLRASLTSKSLLKNSSKSIYRDFIHHSHLMYKLLGLDSLIQSDKIDHLIIIPSEVLNYIPFEALLCSLPADSSDFTNYKNLDYLINHYKISYAYSTSLWHQTMQQQPSGHKGILGFAAAYKNPERWENIGREDKLQKLRSQLIDLPGAKKELEQLEELYAGNFFFGEDANERQFKELDRAQYSVVHLAMHGLLNKEHAFASSLAFTENGDTTEDNFVFAYELTQMPITTDLVVLSACETGYGKFQNGEGVASLARSFMYAGTPSLIMTLWEVNDFSTAEIMQLFYEGLYNGLDKPTALQQAKIKYLNKAKGIASHPFFWSPFVQLGNTKEITLHSKNYTFQKNIFIGIGIFVLLVLGGYVFWRKKRQKREV